MSYTHHLAQEITHYNHHYIPLSTYSRSNSSSLLLTKKISILNLEFVTFINIVLLFCLGHKKYVILFCTFKPYKWNHMLCIASTTCFLSFPVMFVRLIYVDTFTILFIFASREYSIGWIISEFHIFNGLCCHPFVFLPFPLSKFFTIPMLSAHFRARLLSIPNTCTQD